MKLKTNFKILLIFSIILGAMLLFGTTKVQASSYNYNDEHSSGTVTCENGKITITNTDKTKNEKTITEFQNLEDIIGIESSNYWIMNQSNINKFINDRDIPYTIKKKVENDVTSAKTVEGETIEIQTINNEKWLVYSNVLHYKAINICKDEPSIIGFENNDIEQVSWGDSIAYYLNDSTEKKDLWVSFNIETEVTANQNYYVDVQFVNKRGIEYSGGGGAGGGEDGYYLLNRIYTSDASKHGNFGPYIIPANADLSNVYLKAIVHDYQGEKIELNNNKGTLYYEGKEENCYVYKNNLSSLKIKENEMGLLTYKMGNGNKINTFLTHYYRLDENAKEEIVAVEDSTKNEQNIKNKIGISYWGNAKFNFVKIEQNDSIYNNVKNELDKNSTNYYNRLYLDIVDIYRVSGNYGGKLTLTFNVGEEYNGKHYSVTHRINYGEFEDFEGIVENGKIQITVDSLSPFGISIFEKKTANNTNQEPTKPTETTDKGEKDDTPTTNTINKEKDETPKTGTETINIIGYVLATTMLSGIGIVALKKNLK